MTGYLESIESVRHKADAVPYERFPYCCSTDNTLKAEIDLAKKNNVMPKVRYTKQSPTKITVVQKRKQEQSTNIPLTVTFWTQTILNQYRPLLSSF